MQNGKGRAQAFGLTKDSGGDTKNSPPNLRDIPHWDDLRVFAATIEEGSLSRAARALRIQQPTVTRRLNRLEENVRMKLIERTTAGVTPTQEGRKLYSHIGDFTEAMSKGLSGLNNKQEPLRDIRLRITEGLAAYWLSRAMPDLRREMPHIRLKLLTAAYSQEPRNNVHDFEVSFALPQELTRTVMRLGTLNFVPMASQRYVDRYGAPRGKHDLGQHALLENAMMSSQEGPWSQLLDLPEADANVITVMNSMNAYAEFVCAGAGIGLMPTYFQLIRSDLVQIDLPVVVRWPFHLIRSGVQKDDPVLDQFHVWLVSQFDRRRFACFAPYTDKIQNRSHTPATA